MFKPWVIKPVKSIEQPKTNIGGLEKRPERKGTIHAGGGAVWEHEKTPNTLAKGRAQEQSLAQRLRSGGEKRHKHLDS